MTDNSPLRQLQIAELNILKDTIKFFDENKIIYYAIGGTLLGAVRHHGFIPWDDDVDLGLPRESYDRLLALYLDGKCPLNIVGPFNNEDCYWYPARVESKNLKVRRYVHGEETVQNVWLDIIPLDGLPDSKVLWHIYWWHLSYRRMRFRFSRLKKYEPGENPIMNVVKKILLFFLNPEKMDYQKEYDKYDKQMKRYGFQGHPWFIDAEGRSKMKAIAPQAWLGMDTYLQFEDIELRCIADYKRYLTQIYGDYMKKPDDPSIYEHNIIDIFK